MPQLAGVSAAATQHWISAMARQTNDSILCAMAGDIAVPLSKEAPAILRLIASGASQ
jgi:hypothetical protein